MPENLDLESQLNLETTCQIPLFEVKVPGATEDKIARICCFNEDVIWGNYTWQAFPVQVGSVEKDTSQIPSFDLKLSNINRVLEGYFDESNGAVGAEVIIRLVMAKGRNTDGVLVADASPVLNELFDIQESSIDDLWATLKCGFDWSTNVRRPLDMWKKDYCDRKYGDVTCGVDMTTYPTPCDGTWNGCKARNNTMRFKGVPTIGERQAS